MIKNNGIRRIGFAMLVLLLIMIDTRTSFAASLNSDALLNPGNAPSDEVIEFDSTDVNVLYESQTRGANPPTKLYDLSNSNYNVSGSWRYLIYTSRYFY